MEGVHTNQFYPNMTLTTLYSNTLTQACGLRPHRSLDCNTGTQNSETEKREREVRCCCWLEWLAGCLVPFAVSLLNCYSLDEIRRGIFRWGLGKLSPPPPPSPPTAGEFSKKKKLDEATTTSWPVLGGVGEMRRRDELNTKNERD